MTIKFIQTFISFALSVLLSFIIEMVIFGKIANPMFGAIGWVTIFGLCCYLIWSKFWPAFFAFISTFSIIIVPLSITRLTPSHPLGYFSVALVPFALIGLYSFAYHKRLLPTRFWRYFFVIYLIFEIYGLILRLFPEFARSLPAYLQGSLYTQITNPFMVITTIPLILLWLYPLYRLGYKTK